MSPDYSIIVPARDEERYIERALSAVLDLTSELSRELIVVDNGSTDATRRIAARCGATVLELEDATIAAVRNFGASRSRGDVLAFLDADVVVTAAWAAALPRASVRLRDDPLQVLGSRCRAPDEGMLNTYWFNRLGEYSASYINSGNLITSRALFESLGGFDESLSTAEDYDFCQRAGRAGAKVVETPEFEAIHLGYPTSAAGFLQRERWHGSQDFASLSSLSESKVAWLASANLAALLICVAVAALSAVPAWLLLYPLLLAALSAGLTVMRFGVGRADQFLATSAIYALYLWGRSLAGIDRVVGGLARRPCSPR